MANRFRVAAISVFAVMIAALTACNTVEGMGKDLKRGGAAIEDAARSSKK